MTVECVGAGLLVPCMLSRKEEVGVIFCMGKAHHGRLVPPPPLRSVRREERPFSAFVTAVNRQLKPLGFELARGATEDSGEEWLGFVNRAEDAASKLTAFKPAELELFNKIVSTPHILPALIPS